MLMKHVKLSLNTLTQTLTVLLSDTASTQHSTSLRYFHTARWDQRAQHCFPCDLRCLCACDYILVIVSYCTQHFITGIILLLQSWFEKQAQPTGPKGSDLAAESLVFQVPCLSLNQNRTTQNPASLKRKVYMYSLAFLSRKFINKCTVNNVHLSLALTPWFIMTQRRDS